MPNPMAQRLRKLIGDAGSTVAPGCHDAVSARLVEEAGFPAVYVSGYVLQACMFGVPNVGYGTLTEYVKFAGDIAEAVDIPVIVDGETGFGNAIDVRRAVREFESAGVAAMHLEDQAHAWTSHADVKANLLDAEAASAKIGSAKEAQREDDFVLIARTDGGFISADEAIVRSNKFLSVGADVAMPMMSAFLPYSGSTTGADERLDILSRFCAEIDGPVATHCPHGVDFTPKEAADAGAKIYVVPQLTLGPAAASTAAALRAFRDGSLVEHFEQRPPYPVGDLSGMLGMADYVDLAKRLGV